MGILKTRKNKKFSYDPRYYKSDSEGNPFEIRHKFDEFRTTVGDNSGLKNKLSSVWGDMRSTKSGGANKRIALIIAVLILLFLFIIEFDLSIFF